ncbi:MAG: cbb3-type cytochrome oxidase assembly protein CcoS [Chitinophagales bacterium]|nr:cbb3-type cytochrome oxidase assembly protein CcoS [Chitinophagales bacterium]
MSVLFVLLIVSLIVAMGFLVAFIWAIRSGQFDDTYTPSIRMLFEDKIYNTNQIQKPLRNVEENTNAERKERETPFSSIPSTQSPVSSAVPAFSKKQTDIKPCAETLKNLITTIPS